MTTVNLDKNRDSLLSSWKEVCSDNNKTDWAIFSYVKNCPNALEVYSTGSGLQDMVEELDGGKILYAFVRVRDPNTELYKFVLINWQGEGAQLSIKGTCANHFNDITKFFRGAHITMSARTEDEVEPAVIEARVAKASSTRICFKERSDPCEVIGPVGTNYQRIQPTREINVTERESFWEKQQQEEKRRREEEKKKMGLNKPKPQAEVQAVKSAGNNGSSVLSHDHHQDQHKAAKDQTSRADEAKSVINTSSIRNARAMFEQHSTAGQMGSEKPVISVKPTVGSVKHLINGFSNKGSFTPTPPKATPPHHHGGSNVVKKFPQANGSIPHHEPVSAVNKAATTTPVGKINVKISPSSAGTAPSTNGVNKQVPSKVNDQVKGQSRDTVTHQATDIKKKEVEASPSKQPDLKQPSPVIVPVPVQKESSDKKVPSPLPPVDKKTSTVKDTGLKSLIPDLIPSKEPPVIPSPDEEEDERSKKSSSTETEGDDDSRIENEDEEEEDEEDEEGMRHHPPPQYMQYQEPVEHVLEDIIEESEEIEEDASSADKLVSGQAPTGVGIRAKALYDYQAADDTEISFDPDDIITHVDMIDPGWYQGMGPDGSYGLFPANYVEILYD